MTEEQVASAPLADMTWLPISVALLIVVVLTVVVVHDWYAARRVRPSSVLACVRASAVRPRVQQKPGTSSPVLPAARPVVVPFARAGVMRADVPHDGARDLSLYPASAAELEAAGWYVSRLSVTDSSSPVTWHSVSVAWSDLVAVCGSIGRALAVELHVRGIHRDRPVGASL